MSARDWHAIGESIAGVFLRPIERIFGNAVRAHYAEFGTCRRCEAPLGGESPGKVCEECHADELLTVVGGSGGDA
jgi:hypothetical protein